MKDGHTGRDRHHIIFGMVIIGYTMSMVTTAIQMASASVCNKYVKISQSDVST